MLGELLQGRSKTREVEIDAADARLLELLNARPDRAADLRLYLLPVDRLALRAFLAKAADEEDRAVGGGLVLDVEAARRLRVDRP